MLLLHPLHFEEGRRGSLSKCPNPFMNYSDAAASGGVVSVDASAVVSAGVSTSVVFA